MDTKRSYTALFVLHTCYADSLPNNNNYRRQDMVNALLRLALLIAVSLIVPGVINKVKAFWGGRLGPSLFQPFYDIVRLFRKSQVISATTTDVFVIAPVIVLACSLSAACVVPIAGEDAVFSFKGDFVFFAYILALGRFFMILSALDTGSSFEGMGASREVTFSALAEPAFFIIIGSIAMITGKSSFSDIFAMIPGELKIFRCLAFVWICLCSSREFNLYMLLCQLIITQFIFHFLPIIKTANTISAIDDALSINCGTCVSRSLAIRDSIVAIVIAMTDKTQP
ncbi:hydrogenase, component C-formate hydrogenlyase subunit [Candidatus Magnetoovum chiemensis]|nr:hydrogenase, component C-formate hydrogenlyase subunit [Candidatus Magnetoovum chiemensis]